ncbi:MAG TPA: hypothetical protein VMH84_12620 [Xanthobacteraceae bacterium]|nr:hypothetical protein [Xanthobacteraceae bacterium]
MRIVVAVLSLAILTVPAYAEGQFGGKHRHGSEQKADQSKNTVNEKEYQSSLKGIPDQSQNFDPWRNMRTAPQPK